MSNPTEPGDYFFDGIRWRDDEHTSFVTLQAYVTVIRAKWEPFPLLVIVANGKTRFRLDRFEGEWSVLPAWRPPS